MPLWGQLLLVAVPKSSCPRCEALDEGGAAQRLAAALACSDRVALAPAEARFQQRPPVVDAGARRDEVGDSVVAQPEVGTRARPVPLLRPLDQPRPHRIELDIAQAGMEVRLIHCDRGEAALPQMAAPALALVDRPAIAAVDRRQRRAETVGPTRHQNQVDVVRHQTPSPDGSLRFAAPEAQQFEIKRVIAIREEGQLAPIAALGDVVRYSRHDEAGGSRHRPSLAENRNSCHRIQRNQLLWGQLLLVAVPKVRRGGDSRAWPRARRSASSSRRWTSYGQLLEARLSATAAGEAPGKSHLLLPVEARCAAWEERGVAQPLDAASDGAARLPPLFLADVGDPDPMLLRHQHRFKRGTADAETRFRGGARPKPGPVIVGKAALAVDAAVVGTPGGPHLDGGPGGFLGRRGSRGKKNGSGGKDHGFPRFLRFLHRNSAMSPGKGALRPPAPPPIC